MQSKSLNYRIGDTTSSGRTIAGIYGYTVKARRAVFIGTSQAMCTSRPSQRVLLQ